VGAQNSGYLTPYSELRSFTIDSAAAVVGFSLLTPADGLVTASRQQTFTWQALPDARAYIFELLTDPVLDTVLDGTSVAYTLPNSSGDYQWRITAFDANNVARFSNTRGLTLDVTPPALPQLTTPAVDDTITVGSAFVWQRGTEADVADADSVYIYSSQQATEPLAGFPLAGLPQSFTLPTDNDSLLVNTQYYWTVTSQDALGNTTAQPDRIRFYLQDN